MEFDMNFVYNAWAPELDGEKVFFADNIEKLKRLVKSGDISEMDYVHYSEDEEKPFAAEWDCGDTCSKLVYWDPDYIAKANQKRIFRKVLSMGK